VRGRGRHVFAIVLLLGLVCVGSLAIPFARSAIRHVLQPEQRAVRPEGPFDRTPLLADLKTAGFKLGHPAFVRIFKQEARLELWMRDGKRFRLFRAYDICRFSGDLGPKLQEGDRQAPEGFYKVARRQLNPHSRHHLSFNLGFPNAFDRQHGRTGSALMVHGGCSSVGCYAMTDEKIDEIYAVIEAALDGGQREVDVHIFPFRLDTEAFLADGGHAAVPFWRNLAQGYALFEASGLPPKVGACDGVYLFGKDAEERGCEPISGWV